MGKRQSRLRRDELERLSQTTHLTPKELKKWYRGFMKDCPSESLTKEEFCKIYRQFFPFGDAERLASLLFNAFDTNGEGSVDFHQLMSALSTAMNGSTEDKLKWAFRIYDCDHDGYITRDDITNMVDSVHKMTGSMVDIGDTDETPQQRVARLFESMDKDGSGRISLSQFVEGAKSDPIIVKALSDYEDL